MSSSQLAFEIAPITSEADFKGVANVERAAFGTGALGILMFGTGDHTTEAAANHTRSWAEDPTARYVKATLPSGRIIGFGRWNFYTDPSAGPQNPFPTGDSMPEGNPELRKHFFGELNRKRIEVMAGKKHFLMMILAVDPEFQRKGIGKKLLEWGLEKADAEGVQCWIDASPAGKGLYEKMGWREVDVVDVDLGKWGGEEGETTRTVNMVR
jgi:GNAT superfamily N-acetyltransferase